ncbi:Ras- protein Rab-2A [Clydaea vesicula]|uniref:Ras- protein Rab-2A n=1 Tax=Clydaea vesicula TaxID=447962 RepID=A0AAD5XZ79_9FUNG|nr:Ras- protein Rab-2A [Clydaea vesicula]
MSQQYDYLFKYISVGDSGVGKSCLLLRFTNQEYTATETTIGIEFGSSIVDLRNKRIKLQIWDTAGQERSYWMFIITRRESFMHVKNWLEDVMTHGHEEIKIILVANKSDLDSVRQVSTEEGADFAKKHNMIYLETSARQGQNVDQAFTKLAENIFDTFNLSRNVSEISDSEIRNMEIHGVKFGPQKPALSILPNNQSNNQQSGGCC